MIDSKNKKKNFITPEKAASLIPVLISSGISILIIVFLIIPEFIKSNKVNLELIELTKKKDDLPNLKEQYKIINQKFDKLSKEKKKIIELISGTSNLDTLLSKIGEIGKNNNIQFMSIVPKKLVISSDKTSEENEKIDKNIKVDVNIDPLLVEGVKKYLIEFSFRSEFSNFLSFLRELESQENVVLSNDMNLKLIAKDFDNENSYNYQNILEAKLSITFYGKI